MKHVSAVVVLDPESRVWIGIHSKEESPRKGKWVLPGGKLNNLQETYVQAAIREMKEELNLSLESNTLTFIGLWQNKKWHIRYFLTRITEEQKKGMIVCNREYGRWDWMNIGMAMLEIGDDHQAEILKDVLKLDQGKVARLELKDYGSN